VRRLFPHLHNKGVTRDTAHAGSVSEVTVFDPSKAAAETEVVVLAELGQQLGGVGGSSVRTAASQAVLQLPPLQQLWRKQSELELVSGKSCVCGGCRSARYCSSACQKAHWHNWHKAFCKQQQKREAAARSAAQRPVASFSAAAWEMNLFVSYASPMCNIILLAEQ